MRRVESYNAPAFNAAADALMQAGHSVFNPAQRDLDNGLDLMPLTGFEDLTELGFNFREVLGADLAWITEHADGVAVLPGWTDSIGAKIEVATAEALSLPVHDVDYWTGDGAVVYVPAIGDRVRIVDGDNLSGNRPFGVVTELDSDEFCGDGERPHPIVLTDDDGIAWYAVEVELIETAAEIADYEEACREIVARDEGATEGLAEALETCCVPQRFCCGVDPSDHPAAIEWPADLALAEQIAESDRAIEALRVKLGGEEVRVTSATGGQKGQKPAQLSTVDAVALLKLAEVGGYGGRKYEPHNYLRGYAWSLSLDALFRHILAFESGEDLDPESGLPHVTHAAWHCLALTSFMVRNIGTDDRFRQNGV